MRNDRLEAKFRAKKEVRGNWVALFFTSVLIGLPSSVIDAVAAAMQRNVGNGAEYALIGAILGVIGFVVAILLFPASAALNKKYLAVARGEDRRNTSVLCYYRERDWSEKVKAYFLVMLYTTLGLILCVIPGIIIAIKYSMLGYVFADNPNIGYRDAMDKCKELTAGRTWEIFVFHLSFIGWHLLSVLTFGILEIWVIPYENTAFAAWYDLNRPVEDDFASGETDELFQSGTSDFYENTNTLF